MTLADIFGLRFVVLDEPIDPDRPDVWAAMTEEQIAFFDGGGHIGTLKGNALGGGWLAALLDEQREAAKAAGEE